MKNRSFAQERVRIPTVIQVPAAAAKEAPAPAGWPNFAPSRMNYGANSTKWKENLKSKK